MNVLLSALIISFASWLSGRYPTTAGFLIALPIATMLVLPLSYFQHGDQANTVLLARSVFTAIPISLLFFVPFLVAERFALSFWQAYAVGCMALPAGFVVHRLVTRALFVS